MDKILDSDIFIIATVRGKDKYVLEEVDGKQVPRKVGIGYSQRDDLEFLFTVALNIEQDTHLFTSVKDNTHLFENRNDVISEKDGELIYKWATGGDVKSKIKEIEQAKEEAKAKIAQNADKEAKRMAEEADKKKARRTKSLDDLKNEVITLCRDLTKAGKRDLVLKALEDAIGTNNPKNIENIEQAEKAIESLQDL